MKTVKRAPVRPDLPEYAKPGRIVHRYRQGVPDTYVTDDFGDAVEVALTPVLFYIRGPEPSYQPEY